MATVWPGKPSACNVLSTLWPYVGDVCTGAMAAAWVGEADMWGNSSWVHPRSTLIFKFLAT